MWHAVRGQRYNVARDFWSSNSALYHIVAFTVVLRPLFQLTYWLLKWGKDVPDEVSQFPPVVDLLNPCKFPGVRCASVVCLVELNLAFPRVEFRDLHLADL